MTVLDHLSPPTSRKIILGGIRWVTVLSTTVMGRKVDFFRPIYTSLITMIAFINSKRSYIAKQKSNTITWVMRGRVADLRPISTSPITINTCSNIQKRRVASLLIPKSTSYIINTSITSLITTNSLINRKGSNRATRKYTMPTWVMGGRVAGLRHISKSPITIKTCSTI